jgi:hypothetical protein
MKGLITCFDAGMDTRMLLPVEAVISSITALWVVVLPILCDNTTLEIKST